MLSAAKHLSASRDSPFAEFTLSEANVLRVTGIRSKCLGNHQENAVPAYHVIYCNVGLALRNVDLRRLFIL
jgi:hypothetical protein